MSGWTDGTATARADAVRLASFRDLEVWQLSIRVVELVWAHSLTMPGRAFLLRQQMQEAAVSVPSNVAEGYRRKKRRAAYQNHVSIAMGSQGELETQLEIAFRVGTLDRTRCAELVDLNTRVGIMLDRLHDALDP
jgi:four helix bundle protein